MVDNLLQCFTFPLTQHTVSFKLNPLSFDQYVTMVLFVLNFIQFVILENLSILGLALSGVKGLKPLVHADFYQVKRI